MYLIQSLFLYENVCMICKLKLVNRMKRDPVPWVNSCPGGFCCCGKLDSSYQVSKIAEIVWINQKGALENQLDPGQ